MLYFSNEKEFAQTLDKFAEQLEIDARLVVKRIAFELFVGIVMKTPVDTGWARANWTISPNSIKAESSNKNKTIEGEAGAISANNKELSGATVANGDVWYIANNVQYIFWLEAGSSPQSDKGYMIERTMQEVVDNIERLTKDEGDLPRAS